MGASSSTGGVDPDPRIYIQKGSGSTRLQYHGVCYQKGKPSPPSGTPFVQSITHNSLTLHWSSPPGFHCRDILAYRVEIYNVMERRWKIVTCSCQGTSYDVKGLSPDTEYRFRVSAENTYGRSRPGPISPAVRTKSREEFLRSEKGQLKPLNKKLVRRHSHHLKLEGGVTTLLNKTEECKTNYSSVGSIPLRRNSSIRASLPLQRRSVSSVLPGSRRESIGSFRESRRSIEESSLQTDNDSASSSLKLHRISTSTEDDSCNRSTSPSSMASIHEESETGEIQVSPIIPEEEDFFNCKLSIDDDDSLWKISGPWNLSERVEDSKSDCSDTESKGFDNCQNLSDSWDTTLKSCEPAQIVDNSPHCEILTASYSDDTKLAWCSNSRDYKSQTSSSMCNGDPEIWESKVHQNGYNNNNKNLLDLRSLREVLNSEDIMVKTLGSDSNGNYTMNNSNTRRFCGSIVEEDEDSTLDVVSTI